MFRAILLVCALLPGAVAQTPDPAYEPLSKAYDALRAKDYDRAISFFQAGVALSPARVDIRKDFAYTLLKAGESEAARDQFGEAVRLNPADERTALEYAFLCYEAPEREESRAIPFKAEARRIFDRIRQSGDPALRATAEQAFHNVDDPLASGIARWTQAIQTSPSFSAHYELAQLAEQRDELEVAAAHYLAAWKLLPERKSVLIDLGRAYRERNQIEEAQAAWLAASRGGEPRAAEIAHRLLPARYPYVYEFRRALALDPKNNALHRELAYLLTRMAEKGEASKEEAEEEFRKVTQLHPDDLLASAQLGFAYLARGEKDQAMPLLQRVLDGNDVALANRARAALHMTVTPAERKQDPVTSTNARIMAERSIGAGYFADALKYLRAAREADPDDSKLMYQMGSVLNQLHRDGEAFQWFARARSADDPEVAESADRAYRNLRPEQAPARTTTWIFPFYSSRWKDIFTYGQVKTDFRIGKLPFRPYVSMRFVGDTRQTLPGGVTPQYLSESSVIVGVGLASKMWHSAMAWGEAGSSISYLNHHALPDYRGGVSWSRNLGRSIYSKESGAFFESNADSVFVSRFDHDLINYAQLRAGFTPATRRVQTQVLWNAGLTLDAKHQYWATFAETGPGVRFHVEGTPPSLVFSVHYLRGVYLTNVGNPRRPNFDDVRIGFWYAFTH